MIKKVHIDILKIFCIIGLIVLILSYFKCKKIISDKYDILTKSYNFTNYKFLNEYVDGWGLSHLLLYGIMTFIYPNQWHFIFLIGVVWEIIEIILSYIPIFKCYLLNYGRGQVTEWWYARFEDIFMNWLGIIIGYYLKTIFT
jgi:hypothetical protein